MNKLLTQLQQKLKFYYPLAFLLFVALLLRIAFMNKTDNYFHNGDNFSKLKLAYELKKYGAWIISDIWPPVHIYLLHIFALIADDYELAPRLLGVFTCMGTCLLVFLISKKLFGRSVAYFSATIYSFFPLNIIYSVETMTESPFAFFLYLGLWGFILYEEEQSLQNLLIMSLGFSFAAGIRLEAWPLILIVMTYFGWKVFQFKFKKITFFHGVFFSIIALAPICVFMHFCYKRHGRFLYALTNSDDVVSKYYSFNPISKWELFTTLKNAAPFLILELGLLGFILLFYKKKHYWLLSLVGTLFFLPVFKLFNHTLMPFERYFHASSIWLIIACGYLIRSVAGAWRHCSLLVFSAIFVCGSFIFINKSMLHLIKSDVLNNLSIFKINLPRTHFSENQKKFFKAVINLPKEQNIYLDNLEDYLDVALIYIAKLNPEKVTCRTAHTHRNDHSLKIVDVETCFNDPHRRPQFILTSPRVDNNYGELGDFLQSKDGGQFIKRHSLKQIFWAGGYAIWELPLN